MAESQTHSTDEQSIQGLLIISCSHSLKPISLIKKIVRTLNPSCDENEELVEKQFNFGSDKIVKCFDLHIDNKYYLADICLFDIENKDLISRQFADSVHGVVLYFDNNEESSFVGVKSWLPFISEYNSEIKILVCETATDNCTVKRETIQKWCIDNEFELVELNPQLEDNDNDEDNDEDDCVDDFKESHGLLRITQALQAYNWPFMTVKESPQYKPSTKFKDLIDKEIFNSISGDDIPRPLYDELHSNCETISEAKNDCLVEENENHLSVDEENDLENFESLFTQFNDMKVKASKLNDSERKLYAEKVTLAFWKAVGGDDDEIEGIIDTQQVQ